MICILNDTIEGPSRLRLSPGASLKAVLKPGRVTQAWRE